MPGNPQAWPGSNAVFAPGRAPSLTYSFLQSSDRTITDGQFFLPGPNTQQYAQRWYDIPFDRHGLGGNLAFVDGHAEYHYWKHYGAYAWLIAAAAEGVFSSIRYLFSEPCGFAV